MLIVDSLIQQIRSVPENVRTPMISDKEIEDIANHLLLAREYEQAKRMEVK